MVRLVATLCASGVYVKSWPQLVPIGDDDGLWLKRSVTLHRCAGCGGKHVTREGAQVYSTHRCGHRGAGQESWSANDPRRYEGCAAFKGLPNLSAPPTAPARSRSKMEALTHFVARAGGVLTVPNPLNPDRSPYKAPLARDLLSLFDMKKHIFRGSVLFTCLGLFVTGCGGDNNTSKPFTPALANENLANNGSGEIIVSGTVEREMTETTNNEPFVATDQAHTVITVRRYVGEDAEAPSVLQKDVPVANLPFEFELRGEAAKVLGDGDAFLVSVEVYNHAGDKSVVGDLVSEYQNQIKGQTRDMTILVSGLEACDASNAGGYCVSP